MFLVTFTSSTILKDFISSNFTLLYPLVFCTLVSKPNNTIGGTTPSSIPTLASMGRPLFPYKHIRPSASLLPLSTCVLLLLPSLHLYRYLNTFATSSSISFSLIMGFPCPPELPYDITFFFPTFIFNFLSYNSFTQTHQNIEHVTFLSYPIT